MKNTFVFIWEYADDALVVGLSEEESYEEERVPIKKLDTDLLVALKKLMPLDAIEGIGINTRTLGGFASSRLIAATCNMIGWVNQCPVGVVQGHMRNDAEARHAFRSKLLRNKNKTNLIPEYATPPDITPSKRKPGFTIKK